MSTTQAPADRAAAAPPDPAAPAAPPAPAAAAPPDPRGASPVPEPVAARPAPAWMPERCELALGWIQVPFLAVCLLLVVTAAVAVPGFEGGALGLVALGVVAVATLVFAAARRRGWGERAVLLVAVLDVVAALVLRLAWADRVALADLVAFFPVVLLAFAFDRVVTLVAFGALVAITLAPVGTSVPAPDDAASVAVLVAGMLATGGLSLVVAEAARRLLASRNAWNRLHDELEVEIGRTRDQQLLIRTVVSTSGVAMAFYDADRRLVLANDLAHRWCEMAGVDPATAPFAGPEVRRVVDRALVPPEGQAIPRALAGDLGPFEPEWLGEPGRQVAVSCQAVVLTRADGSRWGTAVMGTDVTDLVRSLEVTRSFLATVSHELRTPLAAILNHLELLRTHPAPPGVRADAAPAVPVGDGAPARHRGDPGADDDADRALEAAERNARALSARIDALLDCGGPTTVTLRPSRVDLLVVEVVEDLRVDARRAGVAVVVADPHPVVATVDADLFRKVVANLLGNAVRSSPTGARVTVRVGTDLEELTLAVGDDGVGMTPDEVAQATSPFWRGPAAQRGALRGLGLGLYQVTHAVALHGGRVRITSEAGSGTEVVVRIPRRPADLSR